MSRRSLETTALASPEVAVTYQVSLTPAVIDAVRVSFEHSKLSWPEWVDEAVSRLKRESQEELHNLLTDHKPTSREGKKNLSFRVYPSTLTVIRNLATTYESTVQAVLTHSFFMQSLAADL